MPARNHQRLVTVAMLGLIALAPVMTGCLQILVALLPEPTTQNLAPVISVEDAHTMIQDMQGDPNLVIMDVRTPNEYADGAIENAVNQCLACSKNFAKDLEAHDKTLTYIVYGSSDDTRSGRATDTMVELEFPNVWHMSAGIEGWLAAGYPTVIP